jgi:hypothetical protein
MECAECDNLRCHYESLTFAIARAESALAIADRMYDLEASMRLTSELEGLSEMRREARAALDEHRNAVHRVTVAALAAGASRWKSRKP